MAVLSVLIPSRNEEWLSRTISDILSNITADTEIIAVLDGQWANPVIPECDATRPNVHLIYHPKPIGQRAAINEAARISTAKYVLKCDAHCAFDHGFDTKLMQPYETGEIGGDVTTVPRMYNLHVFDWVCKSCSNRTYQGPRPPNCTRCHSAELERDVVWKPRLNRLSDFMRFDHELHFQYWGSMGKRPEYATPELADQMTCVGACWMMTRERYWEIEPCDEAHGSWGQQGVEVACKSWLSGGRQIVNKRTWFSHCFRTQPGFGFPYPNPGVDKARQYSRKLWLENSWPRQTRPLSWLIERFWPIPDWSDPTGEATWKQVKEEGKKFYLGKEVMSNEQLPEVHELPVHLPSIRVVEGEHRASLSTSVSPTKGIVYYTDCRLDPKIMAACQTQLTRASAGIPIVSVSLAPISFARNIVLPLVRDYLTMFRQILAGLRASTSDIVFLCEHDLLYHPSHFAFTPSSPTTYYYNQNTFKVDANTGQALFYYCSQTSGLCAYRSLLIEHYVKRVEIVEAVGYNRNMGFEPGTHRPPRGVDSYPAERWMSAYPNIDIRHNHNLTPSRWDQSLFRNKNSCLGWKMADEVPGWGVTKGRFHELLAELGLV